MTPVGPTMISGERACGRHYHRPMPSDEIVRMKSPPLDGSEAFSGIEGLEAHVRDFWRFAMPDFRVNVIRGLLAEYLVWRALGVDEPGYIEWDAFDVDWEGIHVEVKSSGLLQAWRQAEPSKLVFTGLKAKWQSIDGKHTDQEAKYKADVYVFAAHMATSHEDYDHLDLRHWQFAVLSRSKLEAIGQKSISWPVVLRSSGGETSWHDLQRAVRAAMVENGDGRS